ncbi:transposase [Streptomyces sp. NPDC056921]|uniref:transposase n=1 Tax=Streptomyces sp. NPDC056921 TaxID=3345966 RepID=UPI003642D184
MEHRPQGVEVACQDGSLTYRQGIAAGAPDAVQVSDRFHLWQGPSRRVQDIASAHRGCLPAALPPDPCGRSRTDLGDCREHRDGRPGRAACPQAVRGRARSAPHRP